MNKDISQYMNTKEVGIFLRRTPPAIRNLVMRRAIPFRKPGGRLVFIKSEIVAWIERAPGVRLEDIDD